MGTNCGPVLANLYLYAYESQFIDRLVSAGDRKTAEQFHRTFRFIDDTLSFDNALWPAFTSKSSEEGGIYPSALTYNDTSVSPTIVHFLGMQFEINSDSHKCTIDIFDNFCATIPRLTQFHSSEHTVWSVHWSTSSHISNLFCAISFSKSRGGVFRGFLIKGMLKEQIIEKASRFPAISVSASVEHQVGKAV